MNISRAPYFADVKARLAIFKGQNAKVTLYASMYGHDPFPIVEKAAPNVDTDIFLKGYLDNFHLFLTGMVIGDDFPSTEVFIRDNGNVATPFWILNAVRNWGFNSPYGKK